MSHWRGALVFALTVAVALGVYERWRGQSSQRKRRADKGAPCDAAGNGHSAVVAVASATQSPCGVPLPLVQFDIGQVLAAIPQLTTESASALIRAIDTENGDAAERARALVTIANSAAFGVGNQGALRENGGLEAVMRLLASRSESDLLAALRAFANLAVNEVNQDTLFAALPAVDRLLSAPNTDIVVAACRCLLNMSVRDDFHHVVRRTNAGKTLARLVMRAVDLRKNSPDASALLLVGKDYYVRRPEDAVMYEAMRVVVNLTCNKSSAAWLSRAGVLEACADVAMEWPIRGPGIDAELLQKAAAALSHILAAVAAAACDGGLESGEGEAWDTRAVPGTPLFSRIELAVARLCDCDDADARAFAVRARTSVHALAVTEAQGHK
eukprot:Opistho-2@30127